MKRKFEFSLYLSIIILSSFVVFLNMGLSKTKRRSISTTVQLDELKNQFETKINNLTNIIGIQFQTEGTSLINNTKVLSLEGDTVLLKNVLGENPKIVLCYTELQCKVCVDNEQKFLKKKMLLDLKILLFLLLIGI